MIGLLAFLSNVNALILENGLHQLLFLILELGNDAVVEKAASRLGALSFSLSIRTVAMPLVWRHWWFRGCQEADELGDH